MRFYLKVFLATFAVAVAVLISSELAILRIISSQSRQEFLRRYRNQSSQIGDTLSQIERTSDLILLNALYVLREKEKRNPLPSNQDLMELKDELKVGNLFILDARGRFIRSDWFITVENDPRLKAYFGGKPLTKSLFSYCADYKNLLTGASKLEMTPILPNPPGMPYEHVDKYIMIPNHDRTRILEAGMTMSFIGEVLNNAMKPDGSIRSIGVFIPNGETLGYVRSEDGGSAPAPRLDARTVSYADPVLLGSSIVFYTKVPTSTGDCCECRTKALASAEGEYYYILRTEVSKDALDAQLVQIQRLFLLIGVVSLFLSAGAAYLISERLVRRLTRVGERVRAAAESDELDLRLEMRGNDEVAVLAQQFDAMMERLKVSRTRLAAAERGKAFSELAQQVAHDIRSPLAALQSLMGSLAKLPEDERLLLRGAAERIKDIANALLERHVRADEASEPAAAETVSLPGLIEPVVSEKRLQFQGRTGVEVGFSPDAACYGLFAAVEPAQFRRLLSNLINNAVEAIPEAGAVRVSVAAEGETEVAVRVRDTGQGIPPHILERLGAKGETHGKAGGSGLGLFHARSCAQRWGGRLELESRPGAGTTASVLLPRARPPAWFVPELRIEPGSRVVILDDDPGIHRVWESRLGVIKPEILHFSAPAAFRAWVTGRRDPARKTMYLVDLEFEGSSETGLGLIEELGLAGQAVLVTGRCDDRAVLDACLRLGTRLIAKNLAGLVPVR